MSAMTLRTAPLAAALLLAIAPAWAQDPHAHHRAHETAEQPRTQSQTSQAEDHTGHEGRASQGHAQHKASKGVPVDMDHSQMDHSKMGHSKMGHAGGQDSSTGQLREPIPPVTDADRRAAFPQVHAHAMHDDSIHSYWSLDRLEAWDADEAGAGVGWEALAWIGTDLDRLWLRSEGERTNEGTEAASIEVLYGRSVSRWWDVVAGLRHDVGEGPSQTFAAFGVQGLAPMKFEVSATAYVGESGQTAAQFEAEYDTLLTNRLVLQWLAEAELYGKDDEARGIGSGLSSVEAGVRLRYEISRQFAPYVGVSWERAYGGTADFKRAHGEDIDETRVVAGIRIWF